MFYLIKYEIATPLHGDVFQSSKTVQARLVDLIPSSFVHRFTGSTVDLKKIITFKNF